MKILKRDTTLTESLSVYRRVYRKCTGFADEATRRVEIGVVNSWGEINLAAVNLDRVTKAVKAGIWAAGGTPVEFAVSSICRGMEGPHSFHLPHRDMVAGYIEAVAETNLLDGMVFVTVCDDVVPAHLMAAARLNLPSIVVTGGYMPLNRCQGKYIEPMEIGLQYYTQFKERKITAEEFGFLEERACTGGGACVGMGSANTMAALTEALGMALPGNASIPGTDARLLRLAFQAGMGIVKLHTEEIRTSDILTREAFENAIRMLMAVGGASDGWLHLQAIAAEQDIYIDPSTFNRLSEETPFICDIPPSGTFEHKMSNLDEAGGIPAVMKELEPLLNSKVMTVTGQILKDNLSGVQIRDRDIIRSLKEPIEKQGGLILIKGNLAPQGALMKRSAVPVGIQKHRGPARIFTSDVEAAEALQAKRIKTGDTIVVSYAGPRGGPGMLVVYEVLFRLVQTGLYKTVALITDGRIGGGTQGCAAGYVSPEAAEGGPLAVVQDGDIIEIDIPNKTLNIDISDNELATRLKAWRLPDKKIKKGLLSIYVKTARSADKGAAMDY